MEKGNLTYATTTELGHCHCRLGPYRPPADRETQPEHVLGSLKRCDRQSPSAPGRPRIVVCCPMEPVPTPRRRQCGVVSVQVSCPFWPRTADEHLLRPWNGTSTSQDASRQCQCRDTALRLACAIAPAHVNRRDTTERMTSVRGRPSAVMVHCGQRTEMALLATSPILVRVSSISMILLYVHLPRAAANTMLGPRSTVTPNILPLHRLLRIPVGPCSKNSAVGISQSADTQKIDTELTATFTGLSPTRASTSVPLGPGSCVQALLQSVPHLRTWRISCRLAGWPAGRVEGELRNIIPRSR